MRQEKKKTHNVGISTAAHVVVITHKDEYYALEQLAISITKKKFIPFVALQ